MIPITGAHAASWQWSSQGGRERIVLELDAARQAGGAGRTATTQVTVGLETPLASFNRNGAAPTAGSLVSGVQAGETGVQVSLRDPAFGYIVSRPDARRVVIDVFPDPLGARWRNPARRPRRQPLPVRLRPGRKRRPFPRPRAEGSRLPRPRPQRKRHLPRRQGAMFPLLLPAEDKRPPRRRPAIASLSPRPDEMEAQTPPRLAGWRRQGRARPRLPPHEPAGRSRRSKTPRAFPKIRTLPLLCPRWIRIPPPPANSARCRPRPLPGRTCGLKSVPCLPKTI